MTIQIENDHDLDISLCAIKNYLLSRTNTIDVRKKVKINLNELSFLNDIINVEYNNRVNTNKTTMYTLSQKDAWEIVRGLIDGKPYAHDDEKSKNAGYNIYTFSGGWISDLSSRLEVNYDNGYTYSVRIGDRVNI